MNIIIDITYLIFGIYTNSASFYAKRVTQDIASLNIVFTEDRVVINYCVKIKATALSA